MTAHTIDNHGVTIAYDERGSGSGRTIVWLHGMSEDRASWDPITDALADEFRSIRVDFRGHGASTRLPHYDGADLLADVAAVVAATCDRPPIMVGHSLGGMVATACAGLGVTGPIINVDQPLEFAGFAAVIHPLAARLRDPSTFASALREEKLALGMDRVPEPMFSILDRKGPASDPNVPLDLWKPMLDDDREALRANDEAFAALASGIDQPYLAIHGLPVEPGYDAWLAATIRTATIEHWTGFGHWLHLVEPPRFADRVRAFAAAHPEADPRRFAAD